MGLNGRSRSQRKEQRLPLNKCQNLESCKTGDSYKKTRTAETKEGQTDQSPTRKKPRLDRMSRVVSDTTLLNNDNNNNNGSSTSGVRVDITGGHGEGSTRSTSSAPNLKQRRLNAFKEDQERNSIQSDSSSLDGRDASVGSLGSSHDSWAFLNAQTGVNGVIQEDTDTLAVHDPTDTVLGGGISVEGFYILSGLAMGNYLHSISYSSNNSNNNFPIINCYDTPTAMAYQVNRDVNMPLLNEDAGALESSVNNNLKLLISEDSDDTNSSELPLDLSTSFPDQNELASSLGSESPRQTQANQNPSHGKCSRNVSEKMSANECANVDCFGEMTAQSHPLDTFPGVASDHSYSTISLASVPTTTPTPSTREQFSRPETNNSATQLRKTPDGQSDNNPTGSRTTIVCVASTITRPNRSLPSGLIPKLQHIKGTESSGHPTESHNSCPVKPSSKENETVNPSKTTDDHTNQTHMLFSSHREQRALLKQRQQNGLNSEPLSGQNFQKEDEPLLDRTPGMKKSQSPPISGPNESSSVIHALKNHLNRKPSSLPPLSSLNSDSRLPASSPSASSATPEKELIAGNYEKSKDRYARSLSEMSSLCRYSTHTGSMDHLTRTVSQNSSQYTDEHRRQGQESHAGGSMESCSKTGQNRTINVEHNGTYPELRKQLNGERVKPVTKRKVLLSERRSKNLPKDYTDMDQYARQVKGGQGRSLDYDHDSEQEMVDRPEDVTMATENGVTSQNDHTIDEVHRNVDLITPLESGIVSNNSYVVNMSEYNGTVLGLDNFRRGGPMENTVVETELYHDVSHREKEDSSIKSASSTERIPNGCMASPTADILDKSPTTVSSDAATDQEFFIPIDSESNPELFPDSSVVIYTTVETSTGEKHITPLNCYHHEDQLQESSPMVLVVSNPDSKVSSPQLVEEVNCCHSTDTGGHANPLIPLPVSVEMAGSEWQVHPTGETTSDDKNTDLNYKDLSMSRNKRSSTGRMNPTGSSTATDLGVHSEPAKKEEIVLKHSTVRETKRKRSRARVSKQESKQPKQEKKQDKERPHKLNSDIPSDRNIETVEKPLTTVSTMKKQVGNPLLTSIMRSDAIDIPTEGYSGGAGSFGPSSTSGTDDVQGPTDCQNKCEELLNDEQGSMGIHKATVNVYEGMTVDHGLESQTLMESTNEDAVRFNKPTSICDVKFDDTNSSLRTHNLTPGETEMIVYHGMKGPTSTESPNELTSCIATSRRDSKDQNLVLSKLNLTVPAGVICGAVRDITWVNGQAFQQEPVDYKERVQKLEQAVEVLMMENSRLKKDNEMLRRTKSLPSQEEASDGNETDRSSGNEERPQERVKQEPAETKEAYYRNIADMKKLGEVKGRETLERRKSNGDEGTEGGYIERGNISRRKEDPMRELAEGSDVWIRHSALAKCRLKCKNSGTMLMRFLLEEFFDHTQLASSSAAGRGHAKRPPLDPVIISALIAFVKAECPKVTESDLMQAINQKCTDVRKKQRKNALQDQPDQSTCPPSRLKKE